MFDGLSDRAKAIVFIALVLPMSLATAPIMGGLVLALSPLVVTLVMMLVLTRDGYAHAGWVRLGITQASLRWWPVALALTGGVSVLASAIAILTVGGRITGPSATAWPDLLSLCITGPILAFAEEIGWRGYLQPYLSRWAGPMRSWILTGLVWLAWHLPYIFLTPFYHAEGDRTVVLALFATSVLAFSFLFGVLRDRSGSLWVPVLAHFAHNAAFAWIGADIVTAGDKIAFEEYLAGDTGLFVLCGTTLSAAFLISRYGRS